MYFLGCAMMYAQLRFAVREGNVDVVDQIWGVSWMIFHSTHKFMYARLTLYVQHVLANVHPGIINITCNFFSVIYFFRS